MSNIEKSLDLETFQAEYQSFREKRDHVLGLTLVPVRRLNEDRIPFMLRLTKWYKLKKGSWPDVDKAFENAQSTGRNCLSIVFDNPIFLTDNKKYLLDQGYAQLINAYWFTAPLDALNWKVKKAPKFNGVDFKDWGDVIGLNYAAVDVHYKFIREFARINNLWICEELSENPFQSECSDQIITSLILSTPHHSIAEGVGVVRSYFPKASRIME